MSRTTAIISRFPQFFRSEEERNTFYEYISVFGQLLDIAEEDLIRVMNAHWALKADNEGSKGFDTATKGDLDKIFALYLENLGGTSLLRQTNRREKPEEAKADDNEYRRRILGLIEVLRDGASTKDGIRRIVAANLGILGDDQETAEARNLIRIEEYMPEVRNLLLENEQLYPNDEFSTYNPIPIPVSPEIRMEILPTFYAILSNLKIIDTNNMEQELFHFPGSLSLDEGNALYFNPEEGVTRLDGVMVDAEWNTDIPTDESDWRFEADVTFGEAHFKDDKHPRPNNDGACRFDFAVFGDVEGESKKYNAGELKEMNYRLPAVDLDLLYRKLHPGSFAVLLPWNIPWHTANVIITAETIEQLRCLEIPENILEVLAKIMDRPFERREDFISTLKEQSVEPTLLEDITSKLPLILKYAAFTDRFSNLAVNPRSQITYIVDKVKAAGVYAEVRPVISFSEVHAPGVDVLRLSGIKIEDSHSLGPDSLYLALDGTITEKHNIGDNLSIYRGPNNTLSEYHTLEEGALNIKKSNVMTTQEEQNALNKLTIRKWDQNGKMVDERLINNMIMLEGRRMIANLFTGYEIVNPVTHCAIGIKDTPSQPQMEALEDEIKRKAFNRKDIKIEVYDEGLNSRANRIKVLIPCTFEKGEANGTLGEAGLFNALKDGTMYNRVVISPPITKTKDFTLTFEWEIIF